MVSPQLKVVSSQSSLGAALHYVIGRSDKEGDMTPGSIVLWAMIFGIPALFMLLAWIGFLTLFRAELSRIFAWPALIFTTSSVWAAIWAIAHIHELAKRSSLDYGFERRVFALAFVGLIAAVIWVFRSRQWSSWGTLSVAVWMSVVFAMICSTM